MSRTEAPLILVFALWSGACQVGIEWRPPLTPKALAATYDRAAPHWTRLTDGLGWSSLPFSVRALVCDRPNSGRGKTAARARTRLHPGEVAQAPAQASTRHGLAERSGPQCRQAQPLCDLFRRVSLTAIGHNESAGTAGQESNV